MWLILPNEGYTPQDLLESGHAIRTVLDPDAGDAATVRVHLSLPKFDVAASRKLSKGLKALGITEVFGSADFSPILPDTEAYVDQVSHAARVKIDEEGVEAAAYTVSDLSGCR